MKYTAAQEIFEMYPGYVRGVVVARGVTNGEQENAEILALRQAAEEVGSRLLVDVTVYCTMEPCPMCAGALVLARVPLLFYAVDDPKAGAAGSVLDVVRSPRLNHQVHVTKGVLADEVRDLLQRFFKELRQSGP